MTVSVSRLRPYNQTLKGIMIKATTVENPVMVTLHIFVQHKFLDRKKEEKSGMRKKKK